METERLRFRKIDDGDFDNLKAIISDPETMKYYSKPYGDEGVNRWIRWCKDCYEKWHKRAEYYPEDSRIETRNYEFYKREFSNETKD